MLLPAHTTAADTSSEGVYFFRLNSLSKMPRRDFPVRATASRLVSIRKYLHRFRKSLTGNSM